MYHVGTVLMVLYVASMKSSTKDWIFLSTFSLSYRSNTCTLLRGKQHFVLDGWMDVGMGGKMVDVRLD